MRRCNSPARIRNLARFLWLILDKTFLRCLRRSFRVTYRTEHFSALEHEADDVAPKRGLAFRILIVSILIGIGSGSALIWRPFGNGAIPAARALTTASGAAIEKPAGQDDLAALRQEIAGSAQSSQQLLAEQQAEIRRLSNEIVALAGKLELLHPMASAQARMPAPGTARPPASSAARGTAVAQPPTPAVDKQQNRR
jgi:hypothetical protein